MSFDQALAVLELDRLATVSELIEQFRWFVKTYHPDNKETGNQEEFRRVVEAYDVVRLSNRMLR